MNSKTKYGDLLVFWITAIAYLFAFIFVFSARTGHNVLGIKYAKAGYLHHFYPSRWSFYALSTSSDKIYRLYRVGDNKVAYEDNRPFSARFFFGLKRDCKISFCETDIIAKDSGLIGNGIRYRIVKSEKDDINKFIRTDTIRYNDVHFNNVLYLKGKYLVTIENQLKWQQMRQAPGQPKTVTVIPVNITAR
jgi:hypothetical protein